MADHTCAVEDCPKAALTRGWCQMHYRRWQTHGDPGEAAYRTLPPELPLADRIALGSEVHESGCWEWTRYITAEGYGSIGYGGKTYLAHRIAYEAYVGPIPDGLGIDHLCRNRSCVNPWHLEPVTWRVNSRRGGNAQKTHCKHGHPFDDANTYVQPRGGRQCKTCRRRVDRRRRPPGARNKETV